MCQYENQMVKDSRTLLSGFTCILFFGIQHRCLLTYSVLHRTRAPALGSLQSHISFDTPDLVVQYCL